MCAHFLGVFFQEAEGSHIERRLVSDHAVSWDLISKIAQSGPKRGIYLFIPTRTLVIIVWGKILVYLQLGAFHHDSRANTVSH